MPELPEVETVTKGLRKILKPKSAEKVTLKEIEWFRPNLRIEFPKSLKKFRNNELQNIERRAKYILFNFENGTIISHLGMTGTWRELKLAKFSQSKAKSKSKYSKHDHIRMKFSNNKEIIYNDPRRFGFVDVQWDEASPWLHHLGPEPLDKKQFTPEYLFAKTRKKKVAIKNLIMDQKIVVGVGNIYASEALFGAGVRPTLPSHKLTKKKSEALVKQIQDVLKKSIKSGGTTLRDFRSADGGKGYFSINLKVYGREGEACQLCKTPIKSKIIGGRSSFWCPSCQN